MIDPQARLLVDAANASPPLDQLGLDQARAWSGRAASRAGQPGAAGHRRGRGRRPATVAGLPARPRAAPAGHRLRPRRRLDPGQPGFCRRDLPADRPVLRVRRRVRGLPACARAPAPGRGRRRRPRTGRAGRAGRAVPPGREPDRAGRGELRRTGCAGRRHGPGPSPRSGDRGLLLACPPVDRTLAATSWRSYGDEFIPRRSQMSWMWDLYLGDHDQHLDGAPDPAADDLTGLPPAIVVVAEYDPLRDEGLTLGAADARRGCRVEVVEAAGQIHPVIGLAPFVAACDGYLEEATRDPRPGLLKIKESQTVKHAELRAGVRYDMPPGFGPSVAPRSRPTSTCTTRRSSSRHRPRPSVS